MLSLGRVSLPPHPEKVLATSGHRPCVRQFYGWSREKWRCWDLPSCLNAWISIMRRISSKKRSHLVPAIFSDLLFVPSMANAMYKAFKPPVLPEASPFAGGNKVPSASSQSEDSGPKPEKSEPSTSKTTQQVQEQVTKASETNSSKADELTPEKESPP